MAKGWTEEKNDNIRIILHFKFCPLIEQTAVIKYGTCK